MKTNKIPQIIKIAVVATVAPRWVIAFLSSDGLAIPDKWVDGWVVVSSILAAAMAICEGIAFAYIFEQWKDMRAGKKKNIVLGFAIASAIAFVVVLMPSMSASARGVTISEYLVGEIMMNVWTGFFALSTMLIVVTVGLAQDKSSESRDDPKLSKAREDIKILKSEIKTLREELSHRDERIIELSEKFGDYEGLLSPTGRDRISAAHKLWSGKLTQKSIAIICDVKEPQVSTEFKILNNENGTGKQDEKIKTQ